MKKTIRFSIILVAFIGVVFTSCSKDEILKIADVKLNSSMKGKVNLAFDEDSRGEINKEITLHLANNDEVAKYINVLKEVNITKITYSISSPSNSNYTEMAVKFHMDGEEIIASKNYNLRNDSGVNYFIIDSNLLSEISNKLFNENQVTFQILGDYQTLPAVEAEIMITVDFEAIANPL